MENIMTIRIQTLLAAAFMSAWIAAASAQSTTPAASPDGPATAPSTGPNSGTAPGNAGSTGWSGSGMGGSHTGTSQHAPMPGSKTEQPETAKGLNPTTTGNGSAAPSR